MDYASKCRTRVFRTDQGGSRNGRMVLVEHSDIIDGDSGSHYTVKEYESIKSENADGWAHQKILLKPRFIIRDDCAERRRYRVVGEFLRALD